MTAYLIFSLCFLLFILIQAAHKRDTQKTEEIFKPGMHYIKFHSYASGEQMQKLVVIEAQTKKELDEKTDIEFKAFEADCRNLYND